MNNDFKDITPAMLLDHMRGMEQRLSANMAEHFEHVDKRFDKVDWQFGRLIEARSRDLKNMDAVEQRLDTIEQVELTAIKSQIGFAST